MDEFREQPRIGAKNWSDKQTQARISEGDRWRDRRLRQESVDGVLWTAADTRGCVVVKFGAREVNGARNWLGDLIGRDGTIEKEFGHQALSGLR